jgi:hypothetical protein
VEKGNERVGLGSAQQKERKKDEEKGRGNFELKMGNFEPKLGFVSAVRTPGICTAEGKKGVEVGKHDVGNCRHNKAFERRTMGVEPRSHLVTKFVVSNSPF